MTRRELEDALVAAAYATMHRLDCEALAERACSARPEEGDQVADEIAGEIAKLHEAELLKFLGALGDGWKKCGRKMLAKTGREKV